MSDSITIRFYEELNDFLPAQQHKTELSYELKKNRSVKDLIESIGVPHTEVDLVIVDGRSVTLDYLVRGGEHISVYPMFESLDISPLNHCQPQPLRETRFVLDVHLGRLAAYLRMLGFDSLYRNDYHDAELADISAEEHRILLTCDVKLLMRKQISRAYFVRSRQPRQQLLEVLSRFDLYHNLQPFTRCMSCNGRTRAVDKRDIEQQLLPKTKKYYHDFYQCENCKKIYWQGTHYQKMINIIKEITTSAV